VSKLNVTYLDFGGEVTTTSIRGAGISSANYDAQVTLMTALRGAMDDIVLGVQKKYQIIAADNILSNTPPTDAFAQRELKWLVTYADDTTGKEYQVEIGTALPTDNVTAGTDYADLTATDIAAFVTAFEAFARAPDDLTHTVTVTSIRLVGRNI